jgi:hypothetical protein
VGAYASVGAGGGVGAVGGTVMAKEKL